MKTGIRFNTLVLGFLLCGGETGDAQEVTSSPAIIVKLAEVDRCHVFVHPSKEPLGNTRVSVVFKNLERPKVDELVREGLIRHSPVWVLDGGKVLLKSRLVGEAIRPGDARGREKCGLLLGFSSPEAALKAAAILRLEPDSKAAEPQVRK